MNQWPMKVAHKARALGITDSILLGGPSVEEVGLQRTTEDLSALAQVVGRVLSDGATINGLEDLGRSLGFNERQLELLAGVSGTPDFASLWRVDLSRTSSGFKILEINAGPGVGALVHSSLPSLAGCIQPLNPLSALAGYLLRRVGGSAGAIVEFGRPFSPIGAHIADVSTAFAREGLRSVRALESSELEWIGGGAWSAGSRLDWLLPIFMLEQLELTPNLFEGLRGVLTAGETVVAVHPVSRFAGSKVLLAWLRESRARALMTRQEQELVERYVPLTRVLSEENIAWAANTRSDLVLKPAADCRGHGVVIGREVTRTAWEAALGLALSDGRTIHVIQQYCLPMAEEVIVSRTPGGTENEVLNLVWGVYIADGSFAGGLLRGRSPTESGVINIATGAAFGPLPPNVGEEGAVNRTGFRGGLLA